LESSREGVNKVCRIASLSRRRIGRYRTESWQKEVGVDPDPRAGYAEAVALLDPALAGRATGRWNPKEASWE